ncbi:MAG: U32 family peptidase [Oscillospiraceae bacterium]|nr:U32 family peptidase [Oscillospiraceae bacterium]
MNNKPEILSPAGDMERLKMAVAFGADAVYLAGKQFGMRGGVPNFTDEELARAVQYCHGRGVRVHVTVNTLPHEQELAALPDYLRHLDAIGADALIVADLGVFRMAQKLCPHAQLHISTQAGIVNAASASAWYELGASRVVLARELSLAEIIAIRKATPPQLEMETFVHGAMCVSFSGRCLLSNYMTGRDGNRGVCAQPCRWKYALVEEKRPGQYFPIGEDDGGTYIMNSKDLCMIDHVQALLNAGVNALKIEGRAKSAYYTAVITNAYHHAVDAALAGKPLEAVWRDEVMKVSHRNYYTGFYFETPTAGQFYEDARYVRDWQVSALVLSCEENGSAVITQRNRFWKGDTLELIAPGRAPQPYVVERMLDENGAEVDCARHAAQILHIQLPFCAPPYTILRKEVAENG